MKQLISIRPGLWLVLILGLLLVAPPAGATSQPSSLLAFFYSVQNLSTPTPTPTATTSAGNGALVGLIFDSVTGERLAGVTLTVDGQTTHSLATGYYRFDNLPPGDHTVFATFPGYQPAQRTRNVITGQIRWNSISMTPAPQPTVTPTALPPTPTPTATATPRPPTSTPTATAVPPTATATPTQGAATGSLIGIIFNAETNARVPGAQVSANGQTTLANQNGVYLLNDLPVGNVPVVAAATGFETTTKTGDVVANTTRWNSIWLPVLAQPTPTATSTATPPLPTATPSPTTVPPTHTPTPTRPTSTATPTPLPSATPTATPLPPTPTDTPAPQTGSLIGLVTDARSGDRLAGARVTVLDRELITDERGFYQFDNLPVGPQTVTAEKAGYETNQRTETVVAGAMRWNSIELTPPFAGCPTTSGAQFDLIPVIAAGDARADYLHGDLNFSLRGFSSTNAALQLVDYAGGTDPNSPQLSGLFEPNRFPGISAVYRAYHWDWSCGANGCRGGLITDWPVTVAGLRTQPGTPLFLPERPPTIYPGNFKAVVLYAEETRLTLGYTREGSVAFGYAIHVENVCVDPNLLALYRDQNNADGFRSTGRLPALRNNQQLGVAFGDEIQVAIRDRGAFLDPRSRKDWWRGF